MAKEELYQRRQAEFAKEIRPYLHYAIQGMATVAIIAFLAGSIGYKQFLQWVTPAFPWKQAAALFMLPFLAGGRIRTYLQEPDTIFLLPREQTMTGYIQSAQRRAIILQGAAMIAIWLIVWPVYAKLTGSGAGGFFLLLFAWVLFKGVLLYGKWMEQQLQEQRTRQAWAVLRWVWAGIAAYGVLALGLNLGLLMLSLGSIVYIALLRLPRKYTVHWLYLIELEERHRASVYRLLNWFVDVPPLRVKARNIHGITRISRMVPFNRTLSFHYLYTLVFLRSELLGIMLRLLIVGILIIACMNNDWAKLGVYVTFALVSGLQLADLKRYYPDSLWHRIYPLPDGLNKQAVGNIRFAIHLTMLVALAIPLVCTLGLTLAWSLGIPAVAAVISFLYHRRK